MKSNFKGFSDDGLRTTIVDSIVLLTMAYSTYIELKLHRAACFTTDNP